MRYKFLASFLISTTALATNMSNADMLIQNISATALLIIPQQVQLASDEGTNPPRPRLADDFGNPPRPRLADDFGNPPRPRLADDFGNPPRPRLADDFGNPPRPRLALA